MPLRKPLETYPTGGIGYSSPTDHGGSSWPSAPAPKKAAHAAARRVALLVATRKGAWLYHGDAARGSWQADGPHFRFFISGVQARDLGQALDPNAELLIAGASLISRAWFVGAHRSIRKPASLSAAHPINR